jgi:apolipoprotein D and lipocalin family protein
MRGAKSLGALACVLWALAGCTGVPEGVEPVRGFDADRYLGTWYEIARLDHRFERGLDDVTATYVANPDGSIAVVNRGLERGQCRRKEARGRAVFLGPRDRASLAVTFFWPFAGGYHVFALDTRDYGWALVSGPSRDYLWILARSPDLPEPVRGDLVARARALGFPVEQLIAVRHDASACPPG